MRQSPNQWRWYEFWKTRLKSVKPLACQKSIIFTLSSDARKSICVQINWDFKQFYCEHFFYIYWVLATNRQVLIQQLDNDYCFFFNNFSALLIWVILNVSHDLSLHCQFFTSHWLKNASRAKISIKFFTLKYTKLTEICDDTPKKTLI